MGAKESKQIPLTYEEALKRVSDEERRGIQDAFRRLSSPGGFLSKNIFIKDLLGTSVPLPISERIFAVCGGGGGSSVANGVASISPSSSVFLVGSQQRGLGFKETLTLLVLLTRGTIDERTKFLFGLLAGDNDNTLDRLYVERTILEWERGPVPAELASLFSEHNRVGYEEFESWLKHNSESLAISRWILGSKASLCLQNKLETPTFYQTLAGVTHLEEYEIVELEKRFWILSSNSNQIDVEVIRQLVTPPLPSVLVQPLFDAFDENRDGHIDFKELSCGVSAACKGPDLERQKFIFKIFDVDCDGRLDRSEVVQMLQCMSHLQPKSNEESVMQSSLEIEEQADEVLKNGQSKDGERWLNIEDYLVWTVTSEIPVPFSKLIFQLCHIVLGLRPQSLSQEKEMVNGWLERERMTALTPGSTWYAINLEWWKLWKAYVSDDEESKTAASHKRNNGVCPQGAEKNSLSIGPPSRGDEVARGTPLQSPMPGRRCPTTRRPGSIDNLPLVAGPPSKVQSLTGEGGKLKSPPVIIRGIDYEMIPEKLWKALQLWYGSSLSLPRQVIRNKDGEVELELYPPSVKIWKHQTIPKPVQVSTVVGGYSAAALHVSGSAFGVPTTTPSTTTKRFHAYQGTFSRRTSVHQIEEFLSFHMGCVSQDIRIWLFKDENNMKLLDNDAMILEDAGIKDEDSLLMELRSKDGTWPEEICSLVIGEKRDKDLSNGPAVPGMVGLTNLGNTCYLNAALQCVANTKVLSQYFKQNCHLHELNKDNPLSSNGKIAVHFGKLVCDMWQQQEKILAPINIRLTICKQSQNFQGFQQQDAQELLAFLLDGLHEDLNRVHIKPYDELKDSAMRPDPIVAKEAWDNHILRNNSVIVDLFHGQLKSRVKCKACGHESVRFDPFTYLSLPLPMENSARIEITLIRQDGSIPIKYGLILDMDSKVSELRPALSNLSRLNSKNIVLAEVNEGRIEVVNRENQKLRGMNGSRFFAYEIQTLSENSSKTHRTSESLPEIQRSTVSRPPSAKGGEVMAKEMKTNITTEPGAKRNDSKPSQDQMEIQKDKNLKEMPLLSESDSLTISHSRQSSLASNNSSDNGVSYTTDTLGDCHNGIIVVMHRKMVPSEASFFADRKYKPKLFGVPLIVQCSSSTTNQSLYKSVWTQVSRLVSPLPPKETSQNHATDCDDSMRYEYPFVLKAIERTGNECCWCSWDELCRGCPIPCNNHDFDFGASYLAIDWDQTALHLRYLTNQERAFVEDDSVSKSLKAITEPITLEKCLEAFTHDEELGGNEKYQCSSCQQMQPATKKLQIWKLPPVLIVHLKRFQHLNGRWIKSHKNVNFPFRNFDPTTYLASVPKKTLERFHELASKATCQKPSFSSIDTCNGDVFEINHIRIPEGSDETDSHSIASHSTGLSNIQLNEEPSNCCESPDDSVKTVEESSDVFHDNSESVESCLEGRQKARGLLGRDRQISTSLQTHPIVDTNLQDFHQHNLLPGNHPFDIKYNVYSVICHTGQINGGHYITYSKASNGKWYCQNDSSCKEIEEDDIDKSSAYMLLYEREGLSVSSYLPRIDPERPLPDVRDLIDDLDEIRKQCVIM